MFEKVNPSHPDKIADRIGGAIVDLGYKIKETPKIAGECMIGHNVCMIMIETDVDYDEKDIKNIVKRIAGNEVKTVVKIVPQDKFLAQNQEKEIRCGDNGIFKASHATIEEHKLTNIVKTLYKLYSTDGKYIYDDYNKTLIACQSCVNSNTFKQVLRLTGINNIIVNPLGDWEGGINVDTGCCNRKLGSDMGSNVTGGGLHFKDISKADVAINVYLNDKVTLWENGLVAKCAIGDNKVKIMDSINNSISEIISYETITRKALEIIQDMGGFEKFAEWGLIR